MNQTTRQTFSQARAMYRAADADPGYDFDNTQSRSGVKPFAHGHVNPTREHALALARIANRLAPHCLPRYSAPQAVSVMRSQFCNKATHYRGEAIARLRSQLLDCRWNPLSRRLLAGTFDGGGYKLLNAKAERIAASRRCDEEQARMESLAKACVVATRSAVEAWRAAA